MKANQRPTYSANIPKSLRGDGADAIALASAFFGDPLPWQEYICRAMLARDKQDKYVCKVFAMSVPRQNGKSWIVRARCFYGLVACGEKILFTCQHGDTADEMFKDLSEVFEDEENVELHELLKAVRKTNGQQAIYLNNGGCVRFTTRTNSLARGKTYDVLIYDEAQELTVAQQAASLPTISAGNLKNPQTIYLGTPPDPECSGTVFKEMHDRVHAGVSDAAWVEWSVSEIGNVSDRRRWERSNPSYGILLSPDAIAAEAASMPPDSLARERLGFWDSSAEQRDYPISSGDWAACATKNPPKDGVKAFAVKFSPDGSRGSIAAAIKTDGGKVYVELVNHFTLSDGIGWLVDWLTERQDDVAEIVVDGRSNSQTLVERLLENGVPKRELNRPSTADFAAACSTISNAVKEKALEHYGQDELTESATRCTRRNIGSGGGWGFESTDDADASIIEAAALAYWGAATTKRDQRRELLIG